MKRERILKNAATNVSGENKPLVTKNTLGFFMTV